MRCAPATLYAFVPMREIKSEKNCCVRSLMPCSRTTLPRPRPAYQDFLTLWKDADPDIPIFIAAKAEYAKLK
jgi:hypothetical protein